MSAIGWPGGSFQVAIDGTPVAAVRTKRVAYSNTPIDITEGENNGWRRLAERGDVRSIEASVEGLATAENWPRLMAEFEGEEFTEIELWHPDGTVQVASAFLSNLVKNGEYNGAVAFSATWLLSGVTTGLSVLTLTSRPYAVEAMDALNVSVLPARPGVIVLPDMGIFDLAVAPLGGELFGGLVDYEYGEPLDLAVEPLGGELFGGLIAYSMAPESIDVAVAPLGGDLFGDLISYEMEPEALDLSVAPLGGTLE